MPRLTKKLLFVLLTIMAYLPMTVMNVANAMPTVSSPVQSQSVHAMNMAMTDMAAADCHHQTNQTCDNCLAQHTSHCVKSACSINLSVAITSPYSLLNISRNFKNSDHSLRINTQFQQPTNLLRPPISI
tara:strand:- start:287904 stop:288290 length:387 start_codon:yes stop_codon:yes gene_type:complete